MKLPASESEKVTERLKVKVWRGNNTAGSIKSYAVPRQRNQTILDLVTWIQRNLEPTLAYRFACRVGMCGSCAMMVNGVPRWTCRTHVDKVAEQNAVTIEPLRNLPVIRDLICDMTEFFEKWDAAEGVFHATSTRDDQIVPVDPDSPQRQAADAGIECINCAICYAACDVVQWNSAYLGPAALNRAWTLVNDVRDGAGVRRLQAIGSDAGCYNCHSQQSCAAWCPNELNPTAAIAGLKRRLARSFLTDRGEK